MKRPTIKRRLLAPTLAAAMLAVAAPASAQYYDRYDSYDRYDRYDRHDTYDRYERDQYYDQARVLSVDPVIDSVAQPIRRDECWREPILVREPVRHYRHGDRYRNRDRTPALVGALVGGVIGNQFGSGHGRDAATLAGSAIGYSVARDANRYDHRGRYYSRDRVYRTYAERCAVRTDWRRDDRVIAYDVTYEYNGQIYRTRTNYHPGDTIRVRVDVDALP